MATDGIRGALLGTSGVGRRLTQEGSRSMDEWIDRVRDAHDWSPERRGQLVEGIFKTRRAAAEQRLERELNRFGLASPAERERLRFRLSEDSPYMRQMRRDAERQADRVIATDRSYREQWAEKRKAEKYPLRNRSQLNAEMERQLADRAEWKTEDIINTEASIAANDAAQQMYAESGAADPAQDPWWYYVGPTDSRSCERCDLLIADTSDGVTRDGLDEMLANANAMAAPLMHVHCRHDAEFMPPRGYVRRKENKEKVQGWACLNGHLEDAAGEVYLITPPDTPPESVRTRFPEFVNDATAMRICGVSMGKAMSCLVPATRLLKWAVGEFVHEGLEMPCVEMEDMAIGDAGEDVVCQILRLQRTAHNDPFDGLSDELGVEIKTLRSTSNDGDPRAYMKKRARERKDQFAREHGVRPVTVYNIVDEEADELRLYVREGFGSFRTGSMTHAATVKRSTGRVVWHVDELPWGEKLVVEAVESTTETVSGRMQTAQWLSELDRDEARALRRWKGASYRYIRDAQIEPDLSDVRDIEMAQTLERAVSRVAPREGVTYRGISVTSAITDEWEEGGEMVFDSFQASSLDENYARNIAAGRAHGSDERPVLFELRGTSGRLIDPANSAEAEVLYLQGSRFNIKEITDETVDGIDLVRVVLSEVE